MPLPIIQQPGRILKKDLGLEKLRSVLIRKVLNIPLPFFIVYFCSRFPNTYLPISKIKELETFTLKKLVRHGSNYGEIDFRMSPPMKIENISARLPQTSIIIKIDITGEYFANKKLYGKKQ